MEITDLKIGDVVCVKHQSPNGEWLSNPMRVIGMFSRLEGPSPEDTVYLDFEGNEDDMWEEEVRNIVRETDG